MKKFSWILALLLALSLAFVGCPAPDDSSTTKKDDNNNNNNNNGGEEPFVPNENVAAIPVTFGTGAGQTKVLFAKVSDEGADVPVGTVSYTADGDLAAGGYKYTYTEKAVDENAGYGNAIGRFKVTLPDGVRLGDFGGVSFKWKGISGDVGLSPSNITYTKNLFILATDTQDELIPYQNDASIKKNIVNTDYFRREGNSGKEFYAGDVDVPQVKGLAGYPNNQKPDVTEPYPIATPIAAIAEKQVLTGDVWFAFYFHSEGGSYSVSDFKLVPAKDFVEVKPPAAPVAEPPVPADIPAGFVAIDLDLTSYMTTADAVSTTVPSVTVEGKTITVPFTANNQRINIPLSAANKTRYYSNVDTKDAYIQIDCETGSEDNFRYHLGIVDTTSNWNATGSLGDFPLLVWKGTPGGVAVNTSGKGIKVTDAGKDKANAATGATTKADYFIFQYRGSTNATVKIKSIKIWVAGEPKGPPVEIVAADIKGGGTSTVTAITDGASVVNANGYENGWIYFKVTLGTGLKLSDYETLSFTIKSVTPDPAPEGSTDLGGYKTASIYAFDDEPTADNIKTAQTGNEAQEWYGQLKNLPKNKIGGGASSGVAGIQDADRSYNRAAPIAIPADTTITDDGEFWIAYFVGGSKGYTYEITNIKLVAGLK